MKFGFWAIAGSVLNTSKVPYYQGPSLTLYFCGHNLLSQYFRGVILESQSVKSTPKLTYGEFNYIREAATRRII